ncbi:MAG TPA: response regulator [Kouleothrix sp.]|uniref:response regulator n=1 Tax=Kouleothrix sp. TaxID=2779161 RepID=UPI002CFDF195|nr:response regulator [Kouleothrix sp.]
MARILIVEDEALNRDMIARRLGWEGFAVILASDGQQALSLALAEQPDLILMDLGLPLINGWEATRQLKAMPATRSIPIIALSAYVLSNDRMRALDAGCDEYETKPIEFGRLLRKMRLLLPLDREVNGKQA